VVEKGIAGKAAEVVIGQSIARRWREAHTMRIPWRADLWSAPAVFIACHRSHFDCSVKYLSVPATRSRTGSSPRRTPRNVDPRQIARSAQSRRFARIQR
jgi:hypothetical protein